MSMKQVCIEVPTDLCELAEMFGISTEKLVEMATKKYFKEVLKASEENAFPVTIYVTSKAAFSIKNDPGGERLGKICQDLFDLGASLAREIVLNDSGMKEGNC